MTRQAVAGSALLAGHRHWADRYTAERRFVPPRPLRESYLLEIVGSAALQCIFGGEVPLLARGSAQSDVAAGQRVGAVGAGGVARIGCEEVALGSHKTT